MACSFRSRTASRFDEHDLDPITEGQRITTLEEVAGQPANGHRLAHSVDPPMAPTALRALVAVHG